GLERTLRLLERVADIGGTVAILWHTDRFSREYARGWDRAYADVLEWVAARRRRGSRRGRGGRSRWRRRCVPVSVCIGGGRGGRHRDRLGRAAAHRRCDLARALQVVAALGEAGLPLEEHREERRGDEDRRVGA